MPVDLVSPRPANRTVSPFAGMSKLPPMPDCHGKLIDDWGCARPPAIVLVLPDQT